MKRKEFIKLAAPPFLILANGNILRAGEYFGDAKKVRLRFAIASDGHYGQPETDYKQYFSTLVKRVNEEHSKNPLSFCVINGDIIHDDTSHFPAAKAALDGLATKYYVTQGNHDHVDPNEWQTIWNMPVNLDFKHGKNSFLLATTSNKEGTFLCPDVSWFREKLAEHSKQDNIFVIIHINPGKLTKYGVDCNELLELFKSHKNIRAVFNGHDHDEEGIKIKNDIPYIFDSHFGGNWGTPYLGFRIVEIMKDNSVLTYILDPVTQINKETLVAK